MLKKLITVLLAACLAGCTGNTNPADATLQTYTAYYDAIDTNTSFKEDSLYYSVTTEMTKMDDGTYRYYVLVNEPQIAMYSIVVMIVENDIAVNETSKMMPSTGIFDKAYTMIPYQVNSADGFVKGIMLSGESDEPEISLKILVEWKDKTGENTIREYLMKTVTYGADADEEGNG